MVLGLSLFFLTGCQLPYLISSAYHQSAILLSRRPITDVLKDPDVNAETKRKLQLVLKVKDFSVKDLGLAENKSYTTYVDLHRNAVTYVVQAAPYDELKHYHWYFPIVGSVPYKGFFSIRGAKGEAAKFNPKKYDTYIRDVSAYSTLGWFNDPVVSPMLGYSDHDLVEVIIHESVHATLYIKSQADFNERLATFLGLEGMKKYYLKTEGENSKTLKLVARERADEKKFSEFITHELDELRQWYKDHKKDLTPKTKAARIAEIQRRFADELKPKLQTHIFDGFVKETLNNASLLTYETYFYDLSDFEKLYRIEDQDFRKVLSYCKTLQDSEDPVKDIKAFLKSHQTTPVYPAPESGS